MPAARRARTHRVPRGEYTRSSAAASRWARAGSSGNGSVSFRPSGVALIATSGSSAPRAGWARAPWPRAQSAKRWARAASRDSTCTSARSSAAATATARAAPPVPTSSQRLAPSTPSCFRHASTPATSVLSPTSSPCSVQNVLHAPTRAHKSVFRARHRSTASLCGTVTFPAPPTAPSAASRGGSAAAGGRIATYTASSPSARIAALCMAGERECVTGSPITASRRVLALISTARELFHDALHRRVDQTLQLGAGVAVHLEVASERIAHLGVVAFAPRVLPEHEDLALTSQLVHPRPVMARHSEDEVRRIDQLSGEQACPMGREIEAALQPHEIRALGHGRTIPRPRARGRHLEVVDATLREGALQQRRRERAAADIPGANEEDLFRRRVLHHGASRPTARRSSAIVSAPSRTSRGAGCVQSTTDRKSTRL